MIHKARIIGIPILAGMLFSQCSQEANFPRLKGPYLGQEPPGMMPEVFAPGIISTGFHEHSFPSFSPDGKQVLWTQGMKSNYKYKFPIALIMMENEGRRWSKPKYMDFSLNGDSGEGFFSPDDNRIYFSSSHNESNVDREKEMFDIWITERTHRGWSIPKNIGEPINTSNHEFQPTLTIDNTLYYLGHYEGGRNNYGIYRSRFKDGEFQSPELLPEHINTEHIDWTPFIAPDESYLLFASFRPGGHGSGDLYICFRSGDDTWSEAINLGPTINKNDNERYPYVSPDGKYLFYLTDKVNERLLTNQNLSYLDYVNLYQKPGNGWSDIYWVDAKIIEDLKAEQSDEGGSL